MFGKKALMAAILAAAGMFSVAASDAKACDYGYRSAYPTPYNAGYSSPWAPSWSPSYRQPAYPVYAPTYRTPSYGYGQSYGYGAGYVPQYRCR